jgi:nicotinamidase-related amidase
MPPALLILDAQNDFFGADNPNLAAFQRSLTVINAASAAFRRRGWPVIFVQHTSPAKPAGSPAWQIHAGFELGPQDAALAKTQHNAFDGSGLQQVLAARGADVLVIAGYVAEYCVLATYRAAQRLRYQAFVLRDGAASLEGFDLGRVDPPVLWLSVGDIETM